LFILLDSAVSALRDGSGKAPPASRFNCRLGVLCGSEIIWAGADYASKVKLPHIKK